MSRFHDATLSAERERMRLRPRPPEAGPSQLAWQQTRRPFQVVTVASNKGGVGKTTIATNLAAYARAQRKALPVMILGLDEQATIDRMFSLENAAPECTVANGLRTGSFAGMILQGRYGVHYVPSCSRIYELKREIGGNLRYLQGVLRRTNWQGLVVVDTKSDLEALTRNAIATSDLTLVVVKDFASLIEAERVYALLEDWHFPRERARIVLSLVDRRIKYREGEDQDVLALLLSEVRKRGFPLFPSFLSSSPKVEALCTNPEARARAILDGAPASLVHRQMRWLTEDVLSALDALGATAASGHEKPASARL